MAQTPPQVTLALPPAPPPDELERQRELARARQQRRRERLRATPAPDPSRPPGTAEGAGGAWTSPAPSSAPSVHATRPMADIGGGVEPERFARIPPLVEHALPVAPADPMAAKKFAAVVAFMAKLTLDDMTARVDLQAVLAAQGFAVSVDHVKAGAIGYVAGCAERVAIKYGLGFSVPFEDELVTGGVVVGSAAYLYMRFTGKLDAQAEPGTAAAPRAGRDTPPADGGLDDDSNYSTLKIRRTA